MFWQCNNAIAYEMKVKMSGEKQPVIMVILKNDKRTILMDFCQKQVSSFLQCQLQGQWQGWRNIFLSVYNY